MKPPLLEISGLTKAYPEVVACDGINLSTEPGEIHAILGENGAGKSTLVKMIYGLVRPDSGSMALEGKPYAPTEPREARNSGVAMVFQHFLLFDALTVAENIALGMDDPPPARQLISRIREKSEQCNLPVHPERRAGGLAAGERQRVEIIRCLLQNPSLIIMDEPTSVLTPDEADDLFATLRSLAKEGATILYISHKLREIRELCERATILRSGKVVESCDPRSTSAGGLAKMMVGENLAEPRRSAKPKRTAEIIQVKELSLPAESAFGAGLENISFGVCPSEILGIGGVSG
ncbi:MAG: ATP-binding cassette domain-containing protein, partial [Albidovulum sp.]|nr:ATP-binding cassette domain-containing protein [Albidovulum sp.]